MLKALTIFLVFQLGGETLSRALALPIPGPVLGMALLLAVLLIRGKGAPDWMEKTADGILSHLSLLFVPAGVGLMQHLPRLRDEWLAIGAALVVSTVLAIAVGAVVFVAVARLTGAREGDAS